MKLARPPSLCKYLLEYLGLITEKHRVVKVFMGTGAHSQLCKMLIPRRKN